MHTLNRSLWSPEADEMRYVNVLAVVTFLILPLWGHGYLKFMSPTRSWSPKSLAEFFTSSYLENACAIGASWDA